MKKIALFAAVSALAFATVLVLALAFRIQPASQALAAVTAPTVVISDSTPTRTESWGTVIHSAAITVAPGAVVKTELLGPVLPGYTWEVTFIDAKCKTWSSPRDGKGLFDCFDKTLKPVLSASGTHYEATIKAPSAPTTVRIDYAYFPPMKPGQTSNTAVKVFEATVVVAPAKP